jgi:hypothetical protein
MLTQTLFVIFPASPQRHVRQSEVSILNAILRSLTLTLAPSGVDRWFVRDERPHWVNIYIILIYSASQTGRTGRPALRANDADQLNPSLT